MPWTLNELVASLPEAELTKIEAGAHCPGNVAAGPAQGVRQNATVIARRLKVGQDAVSKLEPQGDMYISTLRGVLEAMGGELELIARFPDRPPVRLQELGAASPRRKRDRRAA